MRTANPQSLHKWLAKPQAALALAVGLILSGAGVAEETRHPDAAPIFQCTFGEDWDVNYDGWPDRWVRKTGSGLPHYVNIGIHDDETAVGKKCLRIDLDGASAEVESPPIRVMPRFSYIFEARLKNTGLKFSTATITLNFCDAKGRVLQTAKSEALSVTNDWRTIQLGPVEPRDPSITRVTMNLSVQRSSKGDPAAEGTAADPRAPAVSGGLAAAIL